MVDHGCGYSRGQSWSVVMAVTITHLVVCDGVVLEGAEMGL
jgi:hypothetical protein